MEEVIVEGRVDSLYGGQNKYQKKKDKTNSSQNQMGKYFNYFHDQNNKDQRESEREGFYGTCFHYGEEGHQAYEYPQCKEGKIGELKAKPELHMWMKMPSHHILKMKEEKFQSTEESC